MSARTIHLDDRLYEYFLRVAVREPPLLARLRQETARLPERGMQISPEQGELMAFLVELLGVRRAIEVGVFTGYSSTRVALALPRDGRLVACDVSDEWTQIARRYWREAGVDDRVELRLGPAVETLAALVAEGHAGSFDFAFVDADKENYLAYYEACLTLVRPGGVVLFDNVLWDGRVANPDDQSKSTLAIRALNDAIRADARVAMTLIPIGDGLTVARKK
jgi:caffeoyl-CoA O-methyltransferase